jgi:hypothetical protein
MRGVFTLVAVPPFLATRSVRSPTVREGISSDSSLPYGRACGHKIFIDAFHLLFYYPLNTGKEVIEKFMSSNHSEVAET